MSFNMRDYVSNDHIESIGEIAKSQSVIIQSLSLENSKLQTQLQQKENIIKEVRENINKKLNVNSDYVNYDFGTELLRQELLEILDKENSNGSN